MSDQTTDIDVMAVNLLQRERIAELEAENAKLKQLAEPLTIALYKEMSKRHTEVCKENAKLKAQAEEWKREWDILESACDFWKQEAINRGYEE